MKIAKEQLKYPLGKSSVKRELGWRKLGTASMNRFGGLL